MPTIVPYHDTAHRAAVVDLWRRVFDYDTPHNDPALSLTRKLAHRDGLLFVATDDGVVRGTAMAGYDGHRGWLYSIAVDPAARRAGLGTALVRHAEAALAARGCLKINLQLVASNEATAAFYRRLGYAVEPRISMGKVLFDGREPQAPVPPAPTELRPMRAEAWDAFLVAAVASYAEGNVASGRWPADTAVAQAMAETKTLLPAGLATPDHHLMEIWNPALDRPVGALWYAVMARGESRGLFVYQLLVDAAHRRRGHGAQALRLLRALAPGHGAQALALHVFSHNADALRLYESLGYATVSVNMRLPVTDNLDTANATAAGGALA